MFRLEAYHYQEGPAAVTQFVDTVMQVIDTCLTFDNWVSRFEVYPVKWDGTYRVGIPKYKTGLIKVNGTHMRGIDHVTWFKFKES